MNVLVGVGALLALAPTALARPSAEPEAIRNKTEEVFQRPEFKPGPSSTNWVLRQLKAFFDLLGSFFKWLGSLYEGMPLLFWVMLVSCLLLLVGLIALIVYQIRSAFGTGSRSRRESANSTQRIWLSARYRAEGARLAESGDYTEAIRFLFLSLVYRFDERGRVNFHKEYTNREYLEFMNDRHQVRDALQIFVDILDDHWYGQQPCQRDQYESCLAEYERLAV
jgi:hypothetical protein